jgi:hypothetical protein
MVGIVLGLAGYLAYEVGDVVPVLAIDTLGAFDTDRTADLLAYVADEAPLLVASVLPESAEAIQRLDVETGVVTPTDRLSSTET